MSTFFEYSVNTTKKMSTFFLKMHTNFNKGEENRGE